MYFTSWDVNTFLCLISLIPKDIVVGMIMFVKKSHEEFCLIESIDYWVSNSPTLVRVPNNLPYTRDLLQFRINKTIDLSQRINVWKKRRDVTIEFKKEWRYRSIEERHRKVIEWCKFGDEREQMRHQRRLKVYNPSKFYNNDYTNNLWKCWESWWYSENTKSVQFWPNGRIRSLDWSRRNYVSKWYEGIHPARFFLFYKKNKIIEERNRGFRTGPCKDGYVYPQTPIFDWGPTEQLIEDLRCIDGPGIGEPVVKKVEHIDDMLLLMKYK